VPQPRQVEQSARFNESRKNLSIHENLALDSIVRELRNGDDVNGHLSKAILNADKPDLLMADWRIHHIHISNTKKCPTDFFFDRSDWLAFSIVNSVNVYFLDIYPHAEENVWPKDDLLKIVKESWPSLLAGREFEGRLEPEISISSAQRGDARRAGINVPAVIGGSIVFPLGGGITAAGTPISVRNQADRIWNYLGQVRIYLAGHTEFGQQLADELGCGLQDLSLRLKWIDGQIHFREEKSGKYLVLDPDVVRIGGAKVLRENGRWERQKEGQFRWTLPESMLPSDEQNR
jgi:hypothetical protein